MGPVLTLLLGTNPVSNAIGTVIDRLVPDKEAGEKAKRELTEMLVKAEIQGDLAQLEINKVQAQSTNLFVSGARPAFMWVGAAGFGVQFVAVPAVGYVYSLFGYTAPPPMVLDPMLWQVVFGLLGLSYGARTYEKIKGVASK